MTQKRPFTALKHLTIVWLGLVGFNLLLNVPAIESLFKAEKDHVIVSVAEICAPSGYSKEKREGDKSLFFAFFGAAATSSVSENNDKGGGQQSFLDEQTLLGKEIYKVSSFNEALTHTRDRFLNPDLRGPPTV